MNLFLRVIQHLLPNALAWNLSPAKTLRDFFAGLTGLGDDSKTFTDLAWLDIFPDTTRELSAWERQFNLLDTGLSDADRRVRLDGAWKSQGGQSLQYIQDTLNEAGFPVFLHQWFVPGTEPAPGVKSCVTARDPRTVLQDSSSGTNYNVLCGEALAECGEALAECGESDEPLGYPLVNKVIIAEPDILPLCGEAVAECGEALAACGEYVSLGERPIQYTIPSDPDKWHYFLYIGGEVYGEQAEIPVSRIGEFEDLCLKICPAQQWLGIMIK